MDCGTHCVDRCCCRDEICMHFLTHFQHHKSSALIYFFFLLFCFNYREQLTCLRNWNRFYFEKCNLFWLFRYFFFVVFLSCVEMKRDREVEIDLRVRVKRRRRSKQKKTETRISVSNTLTKHMYACMQVMFCFCCCHVIVRDLEKRFGTFLHSGIEASLLPLVVNFSFIFASLLLLRFHLFRFFLSLLWADSVYYICSLLLLLRLF